MKTFNRFCWFAIFRFILIVLLMSFGSCNSVKKNKQSKVYIEQVAKRDIKNLILKNEKESVELVNAISKETTTNDIGKFSGTIADPTKPATVEEETKAGKTTRTYNNFIAINTEDQTERTEKIDSLVQSNTEKEKIISELNQKIDEASKIISEIENSNVERHFGITWWLWILLAVALIVYFWFSRIKKTYLPWKWLK